MNHKMKLLKPPTLIQFAEKVSTEVVVDSRPRTTGTPVGHFIRTPPLVGTTIDDLYAPAPQSNATILVWVGSPLKRAAADEVTRQVTSLSKTYSGVHPAFVF